MENKTLSKEEFEKHFNQIYGEAFKVGIKLHAINEFTSPSGRGYKLYFNETHARMIHELLKEESDKEFPKPPPLPKGIGVGEALKHYSVTFYHKERNKWITTTPEAYEKYKKTKTSEDI